MLKGTSKVMSWAPKWRHGPPRFDSSSDFGRFGVMPKNDDFLDALLLVYKITKIDAIFVSGRVRRDRHTNFGQRGPQGGTLFAHEKLREKIQGKNRGLTHPRPEAQQFFLFLHTYL